MKTVLWFAALTTAFVISKSSSDDNLPSQSSLRFGNGQTDHNELSDFNSPQAKYLHFNVEEQSPSETVYEIISRSPSTSRLAALINKHPSIATSLNTTSSNYTILAPLNSAFDLLPPWSLKSAAELKDLLNYHLVPYLFPASRMAHHPTIPTQLYPASLNGAARFSVSYDISLDGATFKLNSAARVQTLNTRATNGFVHEIDAVLVPPPSAQQVVAQQRSSDFSTLQLALVQTGFGNDLAAEHLVGSTVFAPTNDAFERLGGAANVFLFAEEGALYLRALLRYHVLGNQTFLTNAYYNGQADGMAVPPGTVPIGRGDFKAGFKNLVLDTLLGCPLGLALVRFGPLVIIRLNGGSSIKLQNLVASDGAVHGISRVLVPPKKGAADVVGGIGVGIEVQELKDRLEGWL